MSRNQRNEVVVGIFTVMGVGLLCLLIFLMGGLDRVFGSTEELKVRFHDVQGLRSGDGRGECGAVARRVDRRRGGGAAGLSSGSSRRRGAMESRAAMACCTAPAAPATTAH